MPTILEALRADDGAPHGLTPQETLADIDRLVSDVVAGRLSVTLRVKREPRPWILPWSSPRSVSSRRR